MRKPKFNNGECRVNCNCIEIAEWENGGNEVKNYECLKDKTDEAQAKSVVETEVMPNEVLAGGLSEQTIKDVKSLRDQAKSYHQKGYELSCRWIENLMERILEESQREA